MNVTQKTIAEWRNDSDPKVATMGAKLSYIIGKKKKRENQNQKVANSENNYYSRQI
jgi:hypothetical protein